VKHHPPKPIVQNVPIKNWAHEERPRERMLAGERLSSAELLAIILRTGTGTRSALDLGRELINKFGTLHALEKASISQLTEVPGIGPAKAIEIKAAIELGRRVVQPAADVRDGLKSLGSSRDVFDMYRARYKSATQEEFLLLVLNTKNKIQREVSISVGTLNASIVHPRDVFKPALAEAAAGVVFVHNHPSGDPAPSPEDHALTRRLVEAGNILGIKVLDHVVIGAQTFFSFADNGLLG
jgi:DNA repair protein RadC